MTNMKTCLIYYWLLWLRHWYCQVHHHQRIGQLKIYEVVSVSSVESAMKYISSPNRMIVNNVMQNLPDCITEMFVRISKSRKNVFFGVTFTYFAQFPTKFTVPICQYGDRLFFFTFLIFYWKRKCFKLESNSFVGKHVRALTYCKFLFTSKTEDRICGVYIILHGAFFVCSRLS